MNLKEWFNESVRDKALKVLDELAAQFIDKDGNPDWRQAVNVFSQFCANTLPPPQKNLVDTIVAKLNFTATVNDLRTFWQKIPADVRTILTLSLAENNNPCTWAILGQDGLGVNYGNIKGPWQSLINFKANAGLSLVMQAMDKNAVPLQSVGLTCADTERMFKLGLLGNLVLGAGGSLPLGFIGSTSSVSAGLSITGTATLDYYYTDSAKWLFVEALIHDLPHLASPLDAVDIAAEMKNNLAAIQLNIGGTLIANLGISAGTTWGTQFNVKDTSVDLDTKAQVGASVQAGYQAKLNLAGSWNVLVKPNSQNRNTLNVKVFKATSSSKSSTFSLGASIGISGLDVVGDAVIKKYMPDASALLTALTPYLNMGDLLKQEVIKQLADLLKVGAGGTEDTLKNALVSALVGDSRAADLSNVFGEAAKTALNSELTLLATHVGDEGLKLLTKIVADLKLATDLAKKVIDTASSKMNGLLNDLENQLKTYLTKIITDNQNIVTVLFKPLETVGVDMKTLIGDINTISQQLLGPVIAYLTKYQNLRKKITDAIATSKSLTLGMYIKRISESSDAMNTFLEFQVDTSNANAGAYYQEMLAGNFSNALEAAGKSVNGSDGIMLSGGNFKASASHKMTSDITLNIFGAQFTSQTLMSSDVQVEVDVAGNIMLASTMAEFQRVFSGLGEMRTVQFINNFEIPGAVPVGADFSVLKLIGSGLAMTYSDTKLSDKELKSYLGSVAGSDLISLDSMQKVVQRYDQLALQASTEGKSMGAEIGLNMVFTSDDLQMLLNTADSEIENKALQIQLSCYFVDNSDKYLAFTNVLFKWYLCSNDVYGQIKDIAASGELGDALSKYEIDKENPTVPRDMTTVPILDRHYLNIAWSTGRNAKNLVKIVQNFRNAAKISFSQATLQQDVNTLNGYNNEMNKYLRDWLEVRGILSSLGIQDESVPAVTLAFIATIGEICQMGYKGTEFLTPTVKWSILGDQMELF